MGGHSPFSYPHTHSPSFIPDSPPSSRHAGGLSNFFRRRSSASSDASLYGLSERQRLETMHVVHSALLEPYHTQKMSAHLGRVHASGRRSRVLDVGTGSGTFAVSIARSSPYTDVTAIDIDWSNFNGGPTTNGNLDFSTVDIMKPLPWSANTFDIIHVKDLLLAQYGTLMERLAVILRPGGLLVLVEEEPRFINAVGESSRAQKQWDACVKDACDDAGIDVNLPASLGACLAATGVFMVPAQCQERAISTAGWASGDIHTLAQGGRLHSQMINANMRNLVPLLLDHGYARGDIDCLLERCLAELCQPTSRHYQRLFAFYAQKLGR